MRVSLWDDKAELVRELDVKEKREYLDRYVDESVDALFKRGGTGRVMCNPAVLSPKTILAGYTGDGHADAVPFAIHGTN